MRLRNASLAAASAIALVLAVPVSADAATGDFLYRVGPGVQTGLADPESRACINLPWTTDEAPGSAPANLTTSTATVFLDFDCSGDTFYVMNPGKKLGDRLKLRSVLFS
ncbi:hypothetical protein F7Q99_02160 [Streptomyces kaniharaensis]|uniref:Uncharacterized protein n=1 Tax=Streptomyces kaniharaensis TaxID=212423 RepID=A0A6N7KL11_9ACTN|nr:hypothetical protein [Streptomyces kaniharaensis]MQS11118.1 hypothetical protein [Streptomyces kaniharaensis]